MRFLIILLAVALLGLAGCSSQQKLCDYSEPYNTTETYTETVPKLVEECKNVTVNKEIGKECENTTSVETYYDQACSRRLYNYKASSDVPKVDCFSGNPFACSKGTLTCSYWIQNLEGTSGEWTVNMTLRNNVESKLLNPEPKTVVIPGNSDTSLDFVYPIADVTDASKWSCEPRVVSPVIETCSQVPRTRTVVEEKCTPIFEDVTEEQCSTVTEYVEEEKERIVEQVKTSRRPC